MPSLILSHHHHHHTLFPRALRILSRNMHFAYRMYPNSSSHVIIAHLPGHLDNHRPASDSLESLQKEQSDKKEPRAGEECSFRGKLEMQMRQGCGTFHLIGSGSSRCFSSSFIRSSKQNKAGCKAQHPFGLKLYRPRWLQGTRRRCKPPSKVVCQTYHSCGRAPL